MRFSRRNPAPVLSELLTIVCKESLLSRKSVRLNCIRISLLPLNEDPANYISSHHIDCFVNVAFIGRMGKPFTQRGRERFSLLSNSFGRSLAIQETGDNIYLHGAAAHCYHLREI